MQIRTAKTLVTILLFGVITTIVSLWSTMEPNPKPFGNTRFGQFTNHSFEVKIVHPEGVALRDEEIKFCEPPPEGTEWEGPTVLTVQKDGTIDIHKQVVRKSELAWTIKEMFRQRSCKILLLDLHPELSHGEVVEIVDAAKGAGIIVGLWTDKLREELGYPPRDR